MLYYASYTVLKMTKFNAVSQQWYVSWEEGGSKPLAPHVSSEDLAMRHATVRNENRLASPVAHILSIFFFKIYLLWRNHVVFEKIFLLIFHSERNFKR